MNATVLKGIAMAYLICVWAFLVYIGKADAPSLVDFIKGGVLLLSGHTIFSKGNPNP